MKCTIIIMAKVPLAGTVKTRLMPILSAKKCAEIAECFLQDTINKANSLEYQTIIAYSPPENRNYFDKFQNLNLMVQTGKNLGEKMFNAFQFVKNSGVDSIVMIGTDSPTFPNTFLHQGFEILEQKDAVLGKTEDGGYYLIGLKKIDKRIFENVEWSSENTFEQTKKNLEKLGFSCGETPIWYDVDEPNDLEKLLQDEYLQQFAPMTFEWLKSKTQYQNKIEK